jgi:hypothetical protein
MNDRPGWRHYRPDDRPTTPVPASVWPTGASGLAAQLSDRRYHPATRTDPAVMAPAIAEYAITQFTRPGDIVLDPDCGTGTTIVEALRIGRHAIGLTTHRRWHLARANVTAIKADGAPGDGMVLLRRPSTMTAAQTAGLTGRVDLLLTTLRPATSADTALSRLRSLLHESRPLMRPGGHVVITCPPRRNPARRDLVDLPGQILTLGIVAGLAPVARCLALTADIRGRRIRTHITLTQRHTATRAARVTGHPIALPAHHTVLVFHTDPDATDPVLAQPIPPLRMPPRHRTHTPRLAAVNPIRPMPWPDRIPITAKRAA